MIHFMCLNCRGDSINWQTNYTTIISFTDNHILTYKLLVHLRSRWGAGNGGCQERSLVMNGKLLLSYLDVRHFTSLYSFIGFLFLVTISLCGISSTNQSLNLSFFDAFLPNFKIRFILLVCSVFMLVCFNACS